MSSPTESITTEDQESQTRIVQSIYDHLLRSVVVGYASNMHEMIKTGGISASELQAPSTRQEIFPSLYEGKVPEEIQAELDDYATEFPSRQSRKRKLRQTTPNSSTVEGDLFDEENKEEDKEEDEDDDNDEDFKDENIGEDNDDVASKTKSPGTPEKEAIIMENQPQEQQPPGVDIWGRIPLKEPKHPVECALCGRHLSTTRFASHLEKCMGLSTRPGIPNRAVSAPSTLK